MSTPTQRRLDLGSRWLVSHERGSGDPVLLIHSGGFSSRQWRRLADTLATTNRVMVPDLLGYGASSPWPVGEPFHFEDDVAALEALISGEPPVHLVGHSYGGLLALHIALARPASVRSLALYEPVAFGILADPGESVHPAGGDLVRAEYEGDPWLERFVDWWNGQGAWSRLAPEAQTSFRDVGWKLFQEVNTLLADRTGRAAYARIAVPTLVLAGASSPETERRVVAELARALPRAKLHVFPELGHMGPITHSALVNGAILEHIRTA